MLTSSVGEAGSRMIRVNMDTFRQIGDRHIHFKAKITLILCVFSGSDVRSKWRLLCSLLHLTTKHLNHLIGDILVFLCTRVDSMADSSQLTQGGAACAELRHSDRNLRTAWFEKGDSIIGIKKKNWVDFCHYRMDVYTHLCSNNLKSEFCIRWPL